MAMAKKKNADIESVKKYILMGLLLGGGAASAVTANRTRRLNKKLDEYDSMSPRGENTVVVSVPKSRLSGIGKEASVPDPYKFALLAGSGILSYAAMTALYRRIEDNRMKALEEQAYNDAVKSLVDRDDSVKTAQASWLLENAKPARNVMSLIAFLLAAGAVKRHFDKQNVDSQNLKPAPSGNILFRGVDTDEDPEKNAAFGGDAHKSPVTGISDLSDRDAATVTSIRRILESTPGAKDLVASSALSAGGHNVLAKMTGIPVLGSMLQNETLRRLGLGSSYRKGWDFNSADDVPASPWAKLPFGKDEMAALGASSVYNELKSNRKYRKKLVRDLVDKSNLNPVAALYAKAHPDLVLSRVGIRPMKAKAIYAGEKTAASKLSCRRHRCV